MPYSRKVVSGPLWEPGNLYGLKHGLRSKRVVSANIERVRAELLTNCPWIMEADSVAIETFCKMKARFDMVDAHINSEVEIKGMEGVRRDWWDVLSRVETNLMKATENLGLDPTGRARLLKDMGMANHFGSGPKPMEQLAARGKALRSGRPEAE